jgi:hypothetical protein
LLRKYGGFYTHEQVREGMNKVIGGGVKITLDQFTQMVRTVAESESKVAAAGQGFNIDDEE